jgi:hypothetical protein
VPRARPGTAAAAFLRTALGLNPASIRARTVHDTPSTWDVWAHPPAPSCATPATDEPDITSAVGLACRTAVEAHPGQSVRAEVRTDARMWRRWDNQADAWAPPGPGRRLLVARGLGDIRASLELS